MAGTISVLGLIAAAIIFVVVVWKGWDVFTSTILVSFIIILTSWMNWWDSLTAYAGGYVGFIQSNIFVLIIGAVFGELMGASGCAESIANVITEKLGPSKVIFSITLLSTVFVYVGISGFVVLFVLAPIATVMMKQAGYPYKMIPAIIFIGATNSAMLPYAINITNIIPAGFTNTSMGSAPVLGIAAFVVSTVIGYTYMVHAAKKEAVKDGTAIDTTVKIKIQPTRDDLPSFGIALIPFVLVVALVLGFSNLTSLEPNAVVVLSLFIGAVCIVALCFKQLESVKKILEKGVNNGVGATVMAAAVIGFSGVLQTSPGFQSVISAVMQININPYITEFIALNVLAGILGSGTSSIQMFFEHFLDGLLAKGANAGALHRIAPAAATGMNTLPNAGGMVAQLKWMNLSLAESYWYVFVTSVLAPMAGSLVACVLAVVMY